MIPRLFIYIRQNFVNDIFIFDRSNNSNITLTILTDCDININLFPWFSCDEHMLIGYIRVSRIFSMPLLPMIISRVSLDNASYIRADIYLLDFCSQSIGSSHKRNGRINSLVSFGK